MIIGKYIISIKIGTLDIDKNIDQNKNENK